MDKLRSLMFKPDRVVEISNPTDEAFETKVNGFTIIAPPKMTITIEMGHNHRVGAWRADCPQCGLPRHQR